MTQKPYKVSGAGLGLRRPLLAEMVANQPAVDFLEVAPENWIGVGGQYGKRFRQLTERYPFVCHGLSLSLGGHDPFDGDFLKQLKQFFNDHDIRIYSEHLSYTSAGGNLYDLMPIPFTETAIHHVAGRIRHVQDILERKIAIENVSYYAAPGQEMDEITFLKAVLEEADCELLLDINNIYVNSINHRYDAEDFLAQIPAERVAYCHIAGHFEEAEDLRVDTHGSDVIEPVWSLLKEAYQLFGVMPTLLERDFNLPPLTELLAEMAQICAAQKSCATVEIAHA